MDYDLVLVVGLVIGLLAIPSVLSAWVDGRAPRGAAVTVMIAGVLVVLALTQSPEPYALHQIPHLLVEVLGRYLR